MPLTRPTSLVDADFHEAAWSMMSLLTALMEHGGMLSTAQVAQKADLGRDAARRMLRTMAATGWVRRLEIEGAEWWRIGPELPRIGLVYQEQLAAQARALYAQHGELFRPFRQGDE